MTKKKQEWLETDIELPKKKFKPITPGQIEYVKAIERSEITFCLGNSGCGKSYVPTGLAAKYLLENKISKIIITRPAIEAGEKLGHLPGEIQNKINPFVSHIYDIMLDFMTLKDIKKYEESRNIEIIPLAYMRGRSLHDAFILADEAQNMLFSQLKMLLTRIGQNSKMVICGDVSQVDIKYDIKESPLVYCTKRLSEVDGISIVELNDDDIVRNKLIKIILDKLK
jgi:phosphate starvation-inducible PhoH-like protein